MFRIKFSSIVLITFLHFSPCLISKDNPKFNLYAIAQQRGRRQFAIKGPMDGNTRRTNSIMNLVLKQKSDDQYDKEINELLNQGVNILDLRFFATQRELHSLIRLIDRFEKENKKLSKTTHKSDRSRALGKKSAVDEKTRRTNSLMNLVLKQKSGDEYNKEINELLKQGVNISDLLSYANEKKLNGLIKLINQFKKETKKIAKTKNKSDELKEISKIPSLNQKDDIQSECHHLKQEDKEKKRKAKKLKMEKKEKQKSEDYVEEILKLLAQEKEKEEAEAKEFKAREKPSSSNYTHSKTSCSSNGFLSSSSSNSSTGLVLLPTPTTTSISSTVPGSTPIRALTDTKAAAVVTGDIDNGNLEMDINADEKLPVSRNKRNEKNELIPVGVNSVSANKEKVEEPRYPY